MRITRYMAGEDSQIFYWCTSDGSVRQKVPEGKTVLCWQQFYGIAIAFFQRMFHMKKRYKLVIMTFIYKEKRGLAGKLFYRFVRYAVTSRYVDKIILTTQSEKPMYSGNLWS